MPHRFPAIVSAETEPAKNLEKDTAIHCSLVETALPMP
jgi:hypothetical protein